MRYTQQTAEPISVSINTLVVRIGLRKAVCPQRSVISRLFQIPPSTVTALADGRTQTGDWRLETGDWRLETGANQLLVVSTRPRCVLTR